MKTTKTTKSTKANKTTKVAAATNGETERDRFGSRKGSKGARINRVLVQHKGEALSVSEIMEHSKVGRPRCVSQLTKLLAKKFVKRTDDGYQLRSKPSAK